MRNVDSARFRPLLLLLCVALAPLVAVAGEVELNVGETPRHLHRRKMTREPASGMTHDESHLREPLDPRGEKVGKRKRLAGIAHPVPGVAQQRHLVLRRQLPRRPIGLSVRAALMKVGMDLDPNIGQALG